MRHVWRGVSCVICQVSQKKIDKVVELVGGGSFINRGLPRLVYMFLLVFLSSLSFSWSPRHNRTSHLIGDQPFHYGLRRLKFQWGRGGVLTLLQSGLLCTKLHTVAVGQLGTGGIMPYHQGAWVLIKKRLAGSAG